MIRFGGKEDRPALGLQGRLLFNILLMMTILFFLFAALQISFYRSETEEDFEKTAASYSLVTARIVMDTDISKYAETLTKDEDWFIVKERLDFLLETGKIKYLYVVIPRENGYLYIWAPTTMLSVTGKTMLPSMTDAS